MENKGDVNYQDDMRNQHILRLNNLEEKNSGEYEFRMKTKQRKRKSIEFPGVTLIVTDLLVDVRPAAEVTEGQRVTLTCSTSCPLSENTNYIWYLNSRPLSLTKTPNKHLIIDAVSSQDEGKYSCTVETISSAGKTLTVLRGRTATTTTVSWTSAAAGLSVFLLVLVPLAVFLHRKFKPSHQSSKSEPVNNMDEINTGRMYEEIAAQPAEQELHYSQIALEKINPIYSSFQHHQEQEHVSYSVVKTGTSTNSDSTRCNQQL
ncbi:sialoadhesin-like [Poecilia formosa]|uniref:sialoadhesin-like n=1 Tax=Poecilia formosa TaxID=48698 RepID=UPI0007B9E139|nr:PREDICTED: sialoadhesin-like [Poecilia formosa]